jgi:pimeloyl-ACP methyl ester carboxylesterase
LGVVLVHGFNSGPDTWGHVRQQIERDRSLDFVRVLPFAYATGIARLNPLRVFPEINTVADSLREYVRTEGRPFKNLVVVTHSMGGLVVQRYLARMLADGHGRELARIRRVVMLACPNDGSELLLSLRRNVWGPGGRHPQENELRPLNREVAETRRVIVNSVLHAREVTDRTCPIPFSVYAGESDRVVSVTSARSVFGDAAALPGDHFSILKATTAQHRTFTTLSRHLHETAMLTGHMAAGSPPPRRRRRRTLAATIGAAVITVAAVLVATFPTSGGSGGHDDASGDPSHGTTRAVVTSTPVPNGPASGTHSASSGPRTPTPSGGPVPAPHPTTVAPPPTTPAPPPVPAPHPTSVAPRPTTPAPPPVHHVTETEYHYTYGLAQGYAIDLGSHQATHDATTGSWTTQNFSWGGKDDQGGDHLGAKGWPDSVTVLSASAPNTHDACRNSPRDNGDPSVDGLNPGDRFCLFPGGFDALVTIVSNTGKPGGSNGVLTLDVRVWT